MDKILINDIKLYGYHGVLESEQLEGQYFYVSVELAVDLRQAANTDDLSDTVDYSRVYDIIKQINKNNKFRLIETFAHAISKEIFMSFAMVSEITVLIKKPEAPIDGEFGWVGVEMKRSREDV